MVLVDGCVMVSDPRDRARYRFRVAVRNRWDATPAVHATCPESVSDHMLLQVCFHDGGSAW